MTQSIENASQRSAIARIVEEVFLTMLGLEVSPVDGSLPSADGGLTATVEFSGEWHGAVVLRCTGPQAALFAAKMLGEEEVPEVNDEVRDVLGELANVVGGNMKSFLCPGVALSLPRVSDVNDESVDLSRSNVLTEVNFASEADVFQVALLRAA